MKFGMSFSVVFAPTSDQKDYLSGVYNFFRPCRLGGCGWSCLPMSLLGKSHPAGEIVVVDSPEKKMGLPSEEHPDLKAQPAQVVTEENTHQPSAAAAALREQLESTESLRDGLAKPRAHIQSILCICVHNMT